MELGLLILAAVTGVITAMLIHWLTWYLRRRNLALTDILGSAGAILLTVFFLLFLDSDIRNMMLTVLAVLWLAMLLLGAFQARIIPAVWWKGVLALFLETGLAFVAGAAVNLILQRSIPWFDQQFQGIDVYAIINAFLRALAITLLALAIIRPLLPLIRPSTSR